MLKTPSPTADVVATATWAAQFPERGDLLAAATVIADRATAGWNPARSYGLHGHVLPRASWSPVRVLLALAPVIPGLLVALATGLVMFQVVERAMSSETATIDKVLVSLVVAWVAGVVTHVVAARGARGALLVLHGPELNKAWQYVTDATRLVRDSPLPECVAMRMPMVMLTSQAASLLEQLEECKHARRATASAPAALQAEQRAADLIGRLNEVVAVAIASGWVAARPSTVPVQEARCAQVIAELARVSGRK